jgi:ketosteroid isomerase-like protein
MTRRSLRALPWSFAILFVLLAGALTIGIGCGDGDDGEPGPTSTAQVSASTLLQQLDDAIDRGDVPGAMALFADDAVSEGGPQCSAAPCVGKAAIQSDIEYYATLGDVSFTACTTEDSGNTATARCEVRTNGTRGAGIDRFIASRTVEAQGGKISAFRWGGLDISDEQTATYWADNGAALYQQFLDSINGGDVPAAMALFADDAVFEGEPGCSSAPCAGKDAIQQELERQVAEGISLTSTKPGLFDPFGSTTRVTDILEVSTSAGEPTFTSITVEVVGGKIASVRLETAASE